MFVGDIDFFMVKPLGWKDGDHMWGCIRDNEIVTHLWV